MSRASFRNYFYSFQLLLKYAEFMLYDELVAGILYCNFYQVVQLRKM